jgi:iron complex transport system ATP-binding protein
MSAAKAPNATTAANSVGAVLDVQGLGLQAAGRLLVHDFGLQAHAGQRWAVLGRNAAGKSTLLRALAGLHAGLGTAAAAHIRIAGHSNWQHNAPLAASLRAYLPQHASDRFDLPVEQFLQLHVPGGSGAAIEPQAQALDVAHLLARPITQLSGGERQRVGLCAVALQDAPLWLLDEPVSFQDPAHQQLVGQWLAGHSACIIMVAHDLPWMQRWATHMVACFEDAVWASGERDAILSASNLQRLYGCPWRCMDGLWLPA